MIMVLKKRSVLCYPTGLMVINYPLKNIIFQGHNPTSHGLKSFIFINLDSCIHLWLHHQQQETEIKVFFFKIITSERELQISWKNLMCKIDLACYIFDI